MTFDREELLSVLADASPALHRTATIPGLDHFWFDGSYVYAYDGGLGVRRTFKSELGCGLPGKTLLDLLKTSALKQVDIDASKRDVVLKMGKARVNLVSLDNDRMAWNFPSPGKKTMADALGVLELTEDVLEAITRVSFVRYVGKPTRVVENGITVVPQKDTVEFYSTDSTSLARTKVNMKLSKDFPKFVAPWEFVDRLLELVEPGASLLVLEDCLIVEGKGVLICSNVLDLPDDPDLPKVMAYHLRDEEDAVAEIPAGLQSVLDRAIILAGQAEPIVTFTVEGKSLILEGKYGLGSLDEELPLKGKLPEETGKFQANIVRRALGQAKTFILDAKAIVLDDGSDFVYVHAAWSEPGGTKRVAREESGDDSKPARRKPREEEVDEAPPRRRPAKRANLDDEIPF